MKESNRASKNLFVILISKKCKYLFIPSPLYVVSHSYMLTRQAMTPQFTGCGGRQVAWLNMFGCVKQRESSGRCDTLSFSCLTGKEDSTLFMDEITTHNFC